MMWGVKGVRQANPFTALVWTWVRFPTPPPSTWGEFGTVTHWDAAAYAMNRETESWQGFLIRSPTKTFPILSLTYATPCGILWSAQGEFSETTEMAGLANVNIQPQETFPIFLLTYATPCGILESSQSEIHLNTNPQEVYP